MPLEDFLTPGEQIQFRNPDISYGNSVYELIVTNKRLILYARRGLIFKKDEMISIMMAEIRNIQYKEEGIISKKGILIIDTDNRRLTFYGSPQGIKVAYHNIMQFWGK